MVAWAVSGGPVSTHIVALVKKPAKYPSLEGSAPPTADTLRTYKAGLLQAYLQGFQQTFQEVQYALKHETTAIAHHGWHQQQQVAAT